MKVAFLTIPSCTSQISLQRQPRLCACHSFIGVSAFRLKLATTSTRLIPRAYPSTRTPISASASSVQVASNPILSIASNFIGSLVLIGSLLYKLPQVVRILRRRSARGISVSYYALETVGTTFSAVYFARRSYPFITYGETVFGLIANVAILYMIFFYEKYPSYVVVAYSVCFASMLLFLVSSMASMELLINLQLLSIPLLNIAKVPQIWLNHTRKSTGELAPITLGLQLLGNAARIFTTIAQVRDGLMLASAIVACLFNAVLFGQWFFYNTGTRTVSPVKS